MSNAVADDADSGTSVTEGKATVYFPSEKGVFYNPPQIPNRDLSVLALRHFAQQWQREADAKAALQAERAAKKKQHMAADAAAAAAEAGGDTEEVQPPTDDAATAAAPAPAAPAPAPRGIRVLDALTASGLRALRYVKEISEVRKVVANDLDPQAVVALRNNIERNGISEEVIVPSTGDAVDCMHKFKAPLSERFEAVELDPYGTAAPFLDGAMQCVSEGGLLMVTCTDLAVLCATYPEACHAKYGSYPLKAKYCHEAALRIVLSCMESHANRHKRYIKPLLSIHINFYVRLFVRVYTSPSEVKKSPTKLSHVYQCSGCDTFSLSPLARLVERNGHEKVVPGQVTIGRECEHCGRVHHVGGPLWSAPIHDQAFVSELLTALQPGGDGAELASAKRLTGMLTSLLEELPDVPLFHQLSHMCSTLHVPVPTLVAFVSALMRQGYKVSRSHTDPMAIKTDAPNRALWDVLRCWARTQTMKTKGVSETSPAHSIMAIPPLVEADFRPIKQAHDLLNKKLQGGTGEKVGRFMPNPDEWGPGARSTSHATFSAREMDRKGKEAAAVEGTGGGDAAEDGAAAATSKLGAVGGGGGMLDKRALNQGKRARKRQAREAAAGQTTGKEARGEEEGEEQE